MNQTRWGVLLANGEKLQFNPVNCTQTKSTA